MAKASVELGHDERRDEHGEVVGVHRRPAPRRGARSARRRGNGPARVSLALARRKSRIGSRTASMPFSTSATVSRRVLAGEERRARATMLSPDGRHRDQRERRGEGHDDGVRRDALRADGAPHDLQHGRDLHERRHGHEGERQERHERQRDDEDDGPRQKVVGAVHHGCFRRGLWLGARARPRPSRARARRAKARARARPVAAGSSLAGDLAELREAALAHADDEHLLADLHEVDGPARVEREMPAELDGAARAPDARAAARPRGRRTRRPHTATSVTNVSTRYPA